MMKCKSQIKPKIYSLKCRIFNRRPSNKYHIMECNSIQNNNHNLININMLTIFKITTLIVFKTSNTTSSLTLRTNKWVFSNNITKWIGINIANKDYYNLSSAKL